MLTKLFSEDNSLHCFLKQLGYTVSSWTEAVNQLSKVDGAKEVADNLAYAQRHFSEIRQ
jgi:hypothetical protein